MNDFLITSFTALILGFLIGLERNIYFNEENVKAFAGSRTFALISLLGYLSIYLSKKIPFLIYFSFLGTIILISIAYIIKIIKHKKEGSTTYFAAIITFLIGILTFLEKESAIIITIFTLFLLNIKTNIKNLENKLSSKDIQSALMLLIMTFIVLPLLPDKMVYYINPYKTWLMAVIIASLSFLGYLLIKIVGHKYGILLTGAAGGFISSTGVTLSLSKMYFLNKNNNLLFTYASAIAIANTIMFGRVLVETLLINKSISIILLIPYTLTTILGLIYSYKLYKKSLNNIQIDISSLEKNPLELDEAVKFAIIFGIIYSLSYFISNKYGNIGIYLLSFFSGITDVDAITLSLSSLAKNKIPIDAASIGIAIASFTNSIFKLLIVWFFSSKELAKEITKFFVTILSFFIVTLFLSLTLLNHLLFG